MILLSLDNDVSVMLSSREYCDIFVFYSERFCGILKVFHMSFSNELFSAFHYKSYGTFLIHSKSPIISTVDLPTTEMIEPKISIWGFFCNQMKQSFVI